MIPARSYIIGARRSTCVCKQERTVAVKLLCSNRRGHLTSSLLSERIRPPRNETHFQAIEWALKLPN